MPPSDANKSTQSATERTKEVTQGLTEGAHRTGAATVEEVKQPAASAKTKADELSDTAQAGSQTLVGKAQEITTQAKNTAQPYIDAGVARAQGLVEGVETRINTTSEQTSSAADTLQKEASAKTDAAVTQGQHDTATYFDQAKSLAGAALGTAQGVLQYGAEALGSTNDAAKERAETSGILGTAKSTAASVLDTAAHYSGAAKEKITPHVEDVKATAQPHVDSATEAAQPHIDAIKPKVDATKEKVASEVGDVQSRAEQHVGPTKQAVAAKADPAVDKMQAKISSAHS